MKRLAAGFLLFAMLLSLTGCRSGRIKEVSCEEILQAYQEAGYRIAYHRHPEEPEPGESLCTIHIEDPEDPEKRYLYLDRFDSEAAAHAAAKEQRYHPVLWFVFGVFGEWRWLKTGRYGTLVYGTYAYDMLKPLQKLVQ